MADLPLEPTLAQANGKNPCFPERFYVGDMDFSVEEYLEGTNKVFDVRGGPVGGNKAGIPERRGVHGGRGAGCRDCGNIPGNGFVCGFPGCVRMNRHGPKGRGPHMVEGDCQGI